MVSFSEALHNEARDFGVTVTCLCPGATVTEFQKRSGAAETKLFNSSNVMDAVTVARIGLDAAKRGKPLVVAGRMNALMAFMTRFGPRQFMATVARRLQETKSSVSERKSV